MIQIILVLLGGFLFGILGAFIFNHINSALGFTFGTMLFAVLYCCYTLNEPYDNNISN